MQSGYCELMGLYPAGVAQERQMTTGEQQSMTKGRGLPKMNVRDATSVNADLGVNPLPNGFVSLPIFTFIEKTVQDDVGYSGCNYCYETITTRRRNNASFIDYWWVADFVRDPLADALGIPYTEMDAQDFEGVYDYSDVYVCKTFEGLPVSNNETFDNNTYLEMRTLQKIDLV